MVYDKEAKVGGKPCWRFNNPGNIGRPPSAKTGPPGALDHIGGGKDCGAAVGLYIFDTATSGSTEIGHQVDSGAQKQKYVCSFLLSYSHEGQKYLDAISATCTFLAGKISTADKCDQEHGLNLGSLDADQRS